jgi:hypothetical protein
LDREFSRFVNTFEHPLKPYLRAFLLNLLEAFIQIDAQFVELISQLLDVLLQLIAGTAKKREYTLEHSTTIVARLRSLAFTRRLTAGSLGTSPG